MRRSLYAFSLKGKDLSYEKISNELEEFVENNAPSEDEETEGFINFEKFKDHRKYIYFELYYSFIKEVADPRGIGTYDLPVKGVIPIAVTENPFMLLIFTPKPKWRDKILSKIPLEPVYRTGFTFSSDFIEFINIPEPKDWRDKVFQDVIEPRGRKGREGDTHIITEKYSDPDERDKDLESDSKKYVFRDYAEVLVALEETSVRLTVYPNGKITTSIPGSTLKLYIPYIAEALKVLKDAEGRYFNLKEHQ